MTKPAVGLILLLAGVAMTVGFLQLLHGFGRDTGTLAQRVLPGIGSTFVGLVLFALPLIWPR